MDNYKHIEELRTAVRLFQVNNINVIAKKLSMEFCNEYFLSCIEKQDINEELTSLARYIDAYHINLCVSMLQDIEKERYLKDIEIKVLIALQKAYHNL